MTASMVTASTPPLVSSAAAASSRRLRDRIRRGSMSSSSLLSSWPNCNRLLTSLTSLLPGFWPALRAWADYGTNGSPAKRFVAGSAIVFRIGSVTPSDCYR